MVTGETSNKDKRSWRKNKSSLKIRLYIKKVKGLHIHFS